VEGQMHVSKRKVENMRPIATRIERLDLRELELLELNARYMRHETYAQLVANIKRDGVLTSVPFAWLNPESGKYLVLSGNHRVQAAIDAEVFEADVLVTDDELPEEHRIAIQLSHNALVGEDDPSVLRELYDRLDVDLRVYTGLDDEQLGMIEQPSLASLTEANLEWQSIAFLFLPEELERARAAFALAREQVATDEVWLARRGDADRALDAIADTAAAHGIRNVSAAMTVVLEIFERHRDELVEGFRDGEGELRHKGQVPVSAVLGTDRLPAELAARLRHVLEGIAGRNESTLLEALSALLADTQGDGRAEGRGDDQRTRGDGEAGQEHEGEDRRRPRKRRARPAKRARRRPAPGA